MRTPGERTTAKCLGVCRKKYEHQASLEHKENDVRRCNFQVPTSNSTTFNVRNSSNLTGTAESERTKCISCLDGYFLNGH